MNAALFLAAVLAVGVWLHSRNTEGQGFNDTIRARYQALAYFIQLSATYNEVPSWILKRIGYIESRFDVNARGSAGEVGFMQLTAPVIADYNAAHATDFTISEAWDPWLNVNMAGWLLWTHLNYYDSQVEMAVRAYNTGRGNINSDAGNRYWDKFQEAAQYFPA